MVSLCGLMRCYRYGIMMWYLVWFTIHRNCGMMRMRTQPQYCDRITQFNTIVWPRSSVHSLWLHLTAILINIKDCDATTVIWNYDYFIDIDWYFHNDYYCYLILPQPQCVSCFLLFSVSFTLFLLLFFTLYQCYEYLELIIYLIFQLNAFRLTNSLCYS